MIKYGWMIFRYKQVKRLDEERIRLGQISMDKVGQEYISLDKIR